MTCCLHHNGKDEDARLAAYGMNGLEEACANFMEMEHPLGQVLFHMSHAIMFYVEQYLRGESLEIYRFPKPDYSELMESWKEINENGKRKLDKGRDKASRCIA